MTSFCLSTSLPFKILSMASPSSFAAHQTTSSSHCSSSLPHCSCRCSFISSPLSPPRRMIATQRMMKRAKKQLVVCMAPEEEKLTRRNPLDFPIIRLNLSICYNRPTTFWQSEADAPRSSISRYYTICDNYLCCGCGGRFPWKYAAQITSVDLLNGGPVEFDAEWERPKPGRRPDIFPQFSPMKAPLPPPLPCDPPEEDEEEEEKKEEEEEDPEKEEEDKPEKQQ